MIKMLGAMIVLSLIFLHLVLLGLFLSPVSFLLSTVEGRDDFVEPGMVPVLIAKGVEADIAEHGVLIFAEDGNLQRLVGGMLNLRFKKFMNEEEKVAVYMTLLEFGGDVRGVDAASRYYFKKGAEELSEDEWMTLINLQRMFKS
ncbi:MAG: transglycosylase domain-containing protein [Candidatus Peregrinibacteria bacterium]|nr:transglycosylase domain-containing protein [Candidatus Peregrinibacteria bacterium]